MIEKKAGMFILLCVLIITAGCYTARQFVAVPRNNLDNPVIYLLGDPDIYKCDMKVISNGKEIGIIGSRSYLCWEETAGKISLSVQYNREGQRYMKSTDLEYSFDVKGNTRYYFQIDRIIKTEKNPDYSFAAGLIGAAASGAMKNSSTSSSSSPVINTLTITINRLSEDKALLLIKKWKPPKTVSK